MNWKRFPQEAFKGFKAAFRTRKLAATTLTASLAVFILLTITANLQYSIQTLSFGLTYLDNVLVTITDNTLQTSGLLGLSLTLIYPVLIGVSITNFYMRIKSTGLSDMKQLSGILPGFLAGGCAGCGVGLLSFAGLGGAAAAIPFDGNLIRIGGICLMLWFISRTGDPRTCSTSLS